MIIIMEKNLKIMLLFTGTGIGHGLLAEQIVKTTNGGILMLASIALTLYILITLSEKFLDEKSIKNLFGPGIWPYLTVLYATWLIATNL